MLAQPLEQKCNSNNHAVQLMRELKIEHISTARLRRENNSAVDIDAEISESLLRELNIYRAY